jgi:hypothetical protein
MKKGLTHIIFVVDRSGSMTTIAKDMVGGYNAFIKTQRETSSECFVSLYQFDSIYETVFERVALADVKDLDNETYKPRGSTALFDAIGKTVSNYGAYLSSLPEDQRPERVLVVTITDGENNASKEYTIDQVRDMITHQTSVYSWDFAFLGSNIDAWDAGSSLGIASTSTIQFANKGQSVVKAFQALSRGATSYRVSDAKSAYLFSTSDVKDQDEFLDDKLKSKNKQQHTKTTKKT